MSEDHSEGITYHPKYYDLLSIGDQEQYNALRATLSSQLCRNRRGQRLENFSEMLASIQAFCIRHDEDDWKRCVVCGVCWLAAGIAVNNRQLSILLDKCKSSINGSLQKIGYSTLQSRTESSGALCEAMPILRDNFNDLREWTVRLFVAATPQPRIPIYQVDTSFPFQSPAPSQYPVFPLKSQIIVAPVRSPSTPALETPTVDSGWHEPFFDPFCLEPTFLESDGFSPTPGEPPKMDEELAPAFNPGDLDLFADKWL
jgi:hypothetical protein